MQNWRGFWPILPEGWESAQHTRKTGVSTFNADFCLTPLFSVIILCMTSSRPWFLKASLLNKTQAKAFPWSTNLCRKIMCFLWILSNLLIPCSNIFNWRQPKGKSQLLSIHQAPWMLVHLTEFSLKVYKYVLLLSLVGILLSRKTKSKCGLAKTPHQNI